MPIAVTGSSRSTHRAALSAGAIDRSLASFARLRDRRSSGPERMGNRLAARAVQLALQEEPETQHFECENNGRNSTTMFSTSRAVPSA